MRGGTRVCGHASPAITSEGKVEGQQARAVVEGELPTTATNDIRQHPL